MSSLNTPEVILFKTDEAALNYRYKIPYALDPTISVKSIDYENNYFKENNLEVIGGLPKLNSIYYKHPYEQNKYVSADQGELYFLKQKMALYRMVGTRLGAKKIKTIICSSKYQSQKLDLDSKGSVKIVSGELKIKKDRNESTEQVLMVERSCEVLPTFDIDKNIAFLKDYFDRNNLYHEVDLLTLIEGRSFNETGVITKSEKSRSEVTHEFNSLVKKGLELTHPAFNLSADYQSSVQTINKLVLEIEFEF
ncbi:hypothetical protein [Sphingobacterium sp. 1.A.4]|uniref:hypothetical protein n=1 Tax=Sphingobacterium sp. 1.A.4 TaxID=2044603 RepID=UPI000C0BC309|nr:hypothetical protein [Sphingobacterium sp. 1.A.4]